MTYRVEPCLCGGELFADDSDSASIKDAVVLHQESLLHIVYRAKHGLVVAIRTNVRFALHARAREDYNVRVGISDASAPDTLCDARSVADTSRAGVSRLEVSAP